MLDTVGSPDLHVEAEEAGPRVIPHPREGFR